MKIPKIIHYCWFGGKEKSNIVTEYINNWKKKLPDYEIIEWNESNFDVNYNIYVKEAYLKKKYAFVSDVARLYALYNYGGIYFDTDIEIIKSIDDIILKEKDVFGFESEKKILTAFMASRPKSPILLDMLKLYENEHFINEKNELNMIPNTERLVKCLTDRGMVLNNTYQEFEQFVIYPLDYFSAYSHDFKEIEKTSNTYLIHHCDGSWISTRSKLSRNIKKIIKKIIGKRLYKKIIFLKRKIKKYNSYGSNI